MAKRVARGATGSQGDMDAGGAGASGRGRRWLVQAGAREIERRGV
jgi:hypothetical protein